MTQKECSGSRKSTRREQYLRRRERRNFLEDVNQCQTLRDIKSDWAAKRPQDLQIRKSPVTFAGAVEMTWYEWNSNYSGEGRERKNKMWKVS